MNKKNRLAVRMLALLVLLPLLAACRREQEIPYEVRNLTWPLGAALPEAEDFVDRLPEGWTVSFAEEFAPDRLGETEVALTIRKSNGKKLRETASFSLVRDTEPPVFVGLRDFGVTVGEGIAYRAGVSVRDNCDNPVTFTVDSSEVDLYTEGEYKVYYTAVDAAGNRTVEEVRVFVTRTRVTMETLNAAIDRVIARIIQPGMNTEEKVRAVYSYVYENISYLDTSDKSSWINAAYTSLFVEGSGDCFSYFAASKAFFERLGIENLDVRRTSGIVDERHYWNMVNLSDDPNAPRWYHFDACHLAGAQHSGCLLTDAQIDSYNRQRFSSDGTVNNYFYAYNRADYPATPDQIITRTPSLEPYD